MSVTGIIGGGASGVMAALKASENADNSVIIFEKNPRILKKLLSTGNGKCNLTNTHISPEKYGIQPQSSAARILEKYSCPHVLKYFESIGLYTYADASGRVYPRSNQAAGVSDMLRLALKRENVKIITECGVISVKKEREKFRVITNKGSHTVSRVIVACGSPAAPALGGSQSGYEILSSFGHSIVPVRPSLVQIKTDNAYPKSLKGVKSIAKIRVIENNAVISDVTDEVLFTEYGISGPAALNSSKGNHFDEKGRSFYALLDFLPEFTERGAFDAVTALSAKSISNEDLLTGLMNKRLGQAIIKYARIPVAARTSELSDKLIGDIVHAAKNFRLDIKGTLGFESAQAAAGGANLDEFDDNLESRLISGLFAAGEVLDADGICGGYNLHWAWASGMAAGGACNA